MKTILFFAMALMLTVGISLEGGGGRNITRDRQLSNLPVCENAGIAPMVASTTGEGGGTRSFRTVFGNGGVIGDPMPLMDSCGVRIAVMSLEGGGGQFV